MLTRVICLFTATLAASMVSTVSTVAPAAEGLHFRAAPVKVVVNQSYENVRWSLRSEAPVCPGWTPST